MLGWKAAFWPEWQGTECEGGEGHRRGPLERLFWETLGVKALRGVGCSWVGASQEAARLWKQGRVALIPSSASGLPRQQQMAAGLIGLCGCCRSGQGPAGIHLSELPWSSWSSGCWDLFGVASPGRVGETVHEATMFLLTWQAQKRSRRLLQSVRESRHFNLHVLVGEQQQLVWVPWLCWTLEAPCVGWESVRHQW